MIKHIFPQILIVKKNEIIKYILNIWPVLLNLIYAGFNFKKKIQNVWPGLFLLLYYSIDFFPYYFNEKFRE